jgi:hypothetical protein
MTRTIGLLLLSAAAALAAPLPGEEGTPEYEKAKALVQQLGHARFAVREAAAKQLVEMGAAAVPALAAGTKATDEEVRTRSTALLPQAKAADWRRRADLYLADKDGTQKHDLPLLADWDKLVGKPDAGTRKLFAEIVRTKGEFLAAVAADRAKAADTCARECKLALERLRGPKGQVKAEVGEVAAFLLVDTIAPAKTFNWAQPAAPALLLQNPALPEAIGSAETGPALRRLLTHWAEARSQPLNVGVQQFVGLVRKKPFPEAVPALAKWAKDKKADTLTVRLLAIDALGKAGGKEATETLVSLLDDTTPAFGGRMGAQDELRLGDSAFAALVQMNGKKLADYGLNGNMAVGFANAPGDEPIHLNLYSFNSADARKKGLDKWKAEAAKADPKGAKKDQ